MSTEQERREYVRSMDETAGTTYRQAEQSVMQADSHASGKTLSETMMLAEAMRAVAKTNLATIQTQRALGALLSAHMMEIADAVDALREQLIASSDVIVDTMNRKGQP